MKIRLLVFVPIAVVAWASVLNGLNSVPLPLAAPLAGLTNQITGPVTVTVMVAGLLVAAGPGLPLSLIVNKRVQVPANPGGGSKSKLPPPLTFEIVAFVHGLAPPTVTELSVNVG